MPFGLKWLFFVSSVIMCIYSFDDLTTYKFLFDNFGIFSSTFFCFGSHIF